MPCKTAFFAAFSLLTLALPHAAPAQTPPGWTAQAVGTQTVLTPPDLKAGEFFRIILFPRSSLNGAPLASYLDALTTKEIASIGTQTGDSQPTFGKNVVCITRRFVSKQGETLTALNTAISIEGRYVRVISIITSQDDKLFPRYQTQVLEVTRSVMDQELTAAHPAPKTNTPSVPSDMTPGGPIQPGIYEGDAVYKSDEKFTPRHFKLYLYSTGELRLFRANGDQIEAGSDDYFYDPATGKIGISEQYGLNNYKDSERGFCVYGHDPSGKPFVYAERNYPDGDRRTTTLRYAGPTDMLSSKQKVAVEDAAKAEARRYKYVTAPGKGLKPDQIEGIFEKFQVPDYGVGGPSFVNYLLLKDGTVHEDLPVAPDELNVALSRRREPKQWGRWRRQGDEILMAWPDDPTHFEAVQGGLVTPGKPGERISGHYGGASSGGSFATGGYYAFYGVAFTPDGRFSQDRSGGISSSGLGQTLNDFSVGTTYDNDGATTSVSAPGVVGYAKTKTRARSDRNGTYSINGYALTLHYDNGKIKRMPFYFLSKERYFIFFEGDLLKSDAYK